MQRGTATGRSVGDLTRRRRQHGRCLARLDRRATSCGVGQPATPFPSRRRGGHPDPDLARAVQDRRFDDEASEQRPDVVGVAGDAERTGVRPGTEDGDADRARRGARSRRRARRAAVTASHEVAPSRSSSPAGRCRSTAGGRRDRSAVAPRCAARTSPPTTPSPRPSVRGRAAPSTAGRAPGPARPPARRAGCGTPSPGGAAGTAHRGSTWRC